MSQPADLQPDQRPAAWDDHVFVYESVFEPFTLQFAKAAFAGLGLIGGQKVLDVAAGTGGAALELARLGADVVAIDGAPGMVARISARAAAAGARVTARVMDGTDLAFPDDTFDAAVSIFGVILFPDVVRGLAEMVRVAKPGGRIAVITWTEPQNYELAALLRACANEAAGPAAPMPLPAQLRFVERESFEALFRAAGIAQVKVETVRSQLHAPGADWLLARLAFAPGMAAMLDALGEHRAAVIARFRARLAERFGSGPVALGGVAALGIGTV